MTITIYALKLDNAKYYIRKTINRKVRINDHFIGNGCVLTHKYNPSKSD